MVKYKFSFNATFLFLLFLSMTVSCRKTLDAKLDRIEREINEDPLSAYEHLSELSSKRINTEAKRAKYALLMSMAKDKSYIDEVDDSLVQIAVRYYQKHNDAYHKMLALYSLGRVQYNANNSTAAIVSFTQAKDLAEELKEHHYHGLIMRNMAELYGDSHDYGMEQTYYQASVESFRAIGEQYYAAHSEVGKARSLIAKGEDKQADSILISLEKYAREIDNSWFLSRILKDRALIQTNPRTVIKLYQEAELLGFPIQSKKQPILALWRMLMNNCNVQIPPNIILLWQKQMQRVC